MAPVARSETRRDPGAPARRARAGPVSGAKGARRADPRDPALPVQRPPTDRSRAIRLPDRAPSGGRRPPTARTPPSSCLMSSLTMPITACRTRLARAGSRSLVVLPRMVGTTCQDSPEALVLRPSRTAPSPLPRRASPTGGPALRAGDRPSCRSRRRSTRGQRACASSATLALGLASASGVRVGRACV